MYIYISNMNKQGLRCDTPPNVKKKYGVSITIKEVDSKLGHGAWIWTQDLPLLRFDTLAQRPLVCV